MIVGAGAFLLNIQPVKRVEVFLRQAAVDVDLSVPEKQAIFQVIPPES